jgi:signal transduction histidine kinase
MRQETIGVLLTQVGAAVAIGVMSGTVLLYIHTANQLHAAQREAGRMDERERLARDIHDTLAQGFASVLRHLELVTLELGRHGKTVDPTVARHLAYAESVSRDSLAEIRRLVRALRPVELAEAPLSSAIERIAKRWGDEHGVLADVSLTAVPSLKPDADVIFLRAVQESLNNVARHARARRVHVTLGQVDELVLLTVEDDGCGFAEGDIRSSEHFGLSGMRERVRRFSGHVLIDSKPGAGASVTVAMPLATIAMESVR